MHEALRDIAAKIRRDASSSHFGDPRYAVVISADKVDSLTAAIPELLAQVTDLERRLSIAAELTVGGHQQIQTLETRQQEQEQELSTLKAKAAELEATNDEARRFIRHLAGEIDLLSKYSYDNLRTQGWLDGHASGLDAAFGFLVERAVALFRDRKDEGATHLRRLAEEMVQALRPQMEERSREHALNFPVVVAAAPPEDEEDEKGEGGGSDGKRTWMDDDDEP